MKRAISILIAFVIAMSSALTGFAVYAEEEKESKGINNFIDGIVELTHEYDKGKEFVAPEEDETAQIQAFSARNSEEVTDSTETEYTLQDFQTAISLILLSICQITASICGSDTYWYQPSQLMRMI